MCFMHDWKTYTGLTGLDAFEYCGECGLKKADCKDDEKIEQLETLALQEPVLDEYSDSLWWGTGGASYSEQITDEDEEVE